jgi:hypothetical protein
MLASVQDLRRTRRLLLAAAIALAALFSHGAGTAHASATDCRVVWQTVFGAPIPIMRYENCLHVSGASTRVDSITASWLPLRPGEWICDYRFRVRFRNASGTPVSTRYSGWHYGCNYSLNGASWTVSGAFSGFGYAPWYLGDNWSVIMDLYTDMGATHYGPSPYVRISA